MADKLTLQQQADALIEQAEQKGVANNFFFRTTLKRYQVQMRLLSELEQAINEYGTTVTKEYVKGRQNLVSNPAIAEYNRTTSSANGTVSTLIKIVESFSNEEQSGGKLEELLSALNG